MAEKHPTYANPIIQEALCEFHFRLPDGVDWHPSLFGEVFKNIQETFPRLEPVTRVSVQWQEDAKGLRQALTTPQQQIRYKHFAKNLLLQLAENVFTVNVLPKYPGWEQMRADVLDAWAQVCAVLQPAEITRIGLRYINSIERVHPSETAGDWLKASNYIPRAVLSSLPGFLCRMETRSSPQHRQIITLAEMEPEAGHTVGAIALDIDCIMEKKLTIADKRVVMEISELHDTAWQIFAASITPRLEQRLRGEEVNYER